jgi:hypothetical protein
VLGHVLHALPLKAEPVERGGVLVVRLVTHEYVSCSSHGQVRKIV